VRLLSRRISELFVVLVSSLVIGSGIGFLQSASVLRLSIAELTEAAAIVVPSAWIGGFIAIVVGALVYYLWLRDCFTIGLAAKIVLISVAVGVSTGYLFHVLSILMTPFATVGVSLYWWGVDARGRPPGAPDDRRRKMHPARHRTLVALAVEALSVASASLVLSLGICVWIIECAFPAYLDESSMEYHRSPNVIAAWASGGCLLGLILYYWLLKRGDHVQTVGISISICWTFAIILACFLHLDGWVTSAATAGVAVLATWWLVKRPQRTRAENGT